MEGWAETAWKERLEKLERKEHNTSRKRIQRLPAQLALLRETKTIPLKDCPLGPDWERTKFGFSKRRDNTHYGYLIALK